MQETRSIHDSMNIPKIEFISQINTKYKIKQDNLQQHRMSITLLYELCEQIQQSS